MDTVKDDLYYTEDHEWLEIIGDGKARFGLSDHAQAEMTEVVFVELPAVGDIAVKGKGIAIVESVKTVSDVFSPVSGEIVETNAELEDDTQWINESPYEQGWIATIMMSDPSEVDSLMDADSYRTFLSA